MKHCIIGAGFSGLPVGKTLMELDEDFDILDRNSGIGGLWHTGAYSTAHIISSKRTTEFPDFPMPDWYPDFPSKSLMQRYLADYADAFGLLPSIELKTSVVRVRPDPDHARQPLWHVELANGETRPYRSVIIASGHFSTPRSVMHGGYFSGTLMRSDAYREPSIFKNKRVLVIGGGNTGCDICVDASRLASSVDISIRGGAYFFPKTFLGVPTSDLLFDMPVKFDWTDRLGGWIVGRLAVGNLARYGLTKPAYRLFDKLPVVNTEFLHQIRDGRTTVRPDVSRFDDGRVHFQDGSFADYDIVLYAVGYDVDFPMLHPEDRVLDWENGLPVLFFNMIAPKYRGLFFAGLGLARAGGGPLFEASGSIVARLAMFDAGSREAVITRLTAQPRLRLACRLLGIEPTHMANMRSRGIGEYCRLLRLFGRLLQNLGCPDAPSRTDASRLARL